MRKFLVCAGGVILSLSLYAQRMQHPALLFTKARVEAAKSRMESDTCMERCWSDIRKVADESLKGNNFRRADYLSLAYLMTGRPTLCRPSEGYLAIVDECQDVGQRRNVVAKACVAVRPRTFP